MAGRRVHHASRTSTRFRRSVGAGAVLVLLGAVVWVATAWFGSSPPPRLHVVVASLRDVAGAPLVLHPPLGVGEAVALEGAGTIAAAGSEQPTPIASLTKIMSALVVLRDHPLSPGEPGPLLAVTPADVAAYQAERAEDDSVVAVRAGEQLSELQALEGTLVPSGDNVVQLLATWDAGSTAAFVGKMNALARSLGLTHTRYAGPSGVDPATVSTATDQLRLAEVAMANPVFRSIVAMPQATLPVAGVVYNVDADLGTDGIDGVKTGWVPEGGGCFVFAATTTLDGSSVSIVGAVLGEQGRTPIPTALSSAEQVVAAARNALTVWRLPARTTVGALRSPDGASVPVVTTAPVTLFTWRGATLRLQIRAARVRDDAVAAGRRVGTLELDADGERRSAPLRTAAALEAPPFRWRLLHP